MKYFIGNSNVRYSGSINIINKINSYTLEIKQINISYAHPYALIDNFSRQFKNKNVIIGYKIAIKNPNIHLTQRINVYG